MSERKVYIVRGWHDSGEDHIACASTPAKAEAFIDEWLKSPDGEYHDRNDMDYVEMTVDELTLLPYTPAPDEGDSNATAE